MTASRSILAEFDDVKAEFMDEILAAIRDTMTRTVSADSSLVQMADYHLETGGKRLRAVIPLMVAKRFGVDPRRMIGFAAACEILHNATLVHDDLQDGDTVRRGKPTVWAKWGAPRAINLGDAMLYWTLHAANTVDFDEAARMRLWSTIVTDTLRVIQGQEDEFALAASDRPTVEAYRRMVRGKTSGLFSLPIVGAADLCGDAWVAADLLAPSMRLGELFQMQDDVLDLYGDKGRGQRGGDIGEGKISILVAHFMEHGPTESVEWLRGVLKAPREELTTDQVDRVAELFRDHGTLQWVLDYISDLRRQIAEEPSLTGSALREALQDLLAGLADLLMEPIHGI